MICVAEDDLRVQIVEQIARQKRFDGRLGSHRHEYGGFNIAVRGVQNAGARTGGGTSGVKLETGHRIYCRIDAVRTLLFFARRSASPHSDAGVS